MSSSSTLKVKVVIFENDILKHFAYYLKHRFNSYKPYRCLHQSKVYKKGRWAHINVKLLH